MSPLSHPQPSAPQDEPTGETTAGETSEFALGTSILTHEAYFEPMRGASGVACLVLQRRRGCACTAASASRRGGRRAGAPMQVIAQSLPHRNHLFLSNNCFIDTQVRSPRAQGDWRMNLPHRSFMPLIASRVYAGKDKESIHQCLPQRGPRE